MKKTVFLSIFLLIINSIAFTQITVQAKIDSSMLLIGEQTTLRLEVIQDKNSTVQFPILTDSIVKGIDIVSVSKQDTSVLENGQLKINRDVIITSFDSALYYIPSLKFFAGKDSFETNPLSLKVYTIPVDTTKGIYDIKPIYKAKIDWKQVFMIVLIILLSLAVLVIVYLYIKKRFFSKNETVQEAKIPSIPPHELALKELDRIKDEKIWQQGRIKEYYTEVTTVLRLYIEHRFLIAALEMTSDEILESLQQLDIAPKTIENKLQQILVVADLVKFAKWIPTTLEIETTLNKAYSFVNQTKDETTSTEVDAINENESELA